MNWKNSLAVFSCRFSQANQWEALLGLHEQSQTSKWTMKRGVKRIIVHPGYDLETYDNDITLMELDNSVTLNQNIWPICLPSPAHDFPVGEEAWITGWGATREGGEMMRMTRTQLVWNVRISHTGSVVEVFKCVCNETFPQTNLTDPTDVSAQPASGFNTKHCSERPNSKDNNVPQHKIHPTTALHSQTAGSNVRYLHVKWDAQPSFFRPSSTDLSVCRHTLCF